MLFRSKIRLLLHRTLNFEFPGADGALKMTKLMAALRSDAPSSLAGFPVTECVDYQGGIAGLPSANVVEFRLPDTNKIIFRPSGTEPKVKAYLFAKGATDEEAKALLERFEQAVKELIEA